jgi:hypothetical protein
MSANGTAKGASPRGDFPYFRSLWNLVVVLLLAAAFLPLLLLGGIIYVYTTGALEENALETLRLQVQDHRAVIDQFLSERASDLRLLATNVGFAQLTSAGVLERAYRSLQQELACFSDLGIDAHSFGKLQLEKLAVGGARTWSNARLSKTKIGANNSTIGAIL